VSIYDREGLSTDGPEAALPAAATEQFKASGGELFPSVGQNGRDSENSTQRCVVEPTHATVATGRLGFAPGVRDLWSFDLRRTEFVGRVVGHAIETLGRTRDCSPDTADSGCTALTFARNWFSLRDMSLKGYLPGLS
jgi:hypothetical protein